MVPCGEGHCRPTGRWPPLVINYRPSHSLHLVHLETEPNCISSLPKRNQGWSHDVSAKHNLASHLTALLCYSGSTAATDPTLVPTAKVFGLTTADQALPLRQIWSANLAESGVTCRLRSRYVPCRSLHATCFHVTSHNEHYQLTSSDCL
jgi:hypothetical protein